MAGQTGLSTFDIATELLKKGRRFSFFQVMRLMRLLGHDPETVEDAQTFARQVQSLRIRPQNNLSFPASDVASVERTEGETPGFLVDASFLGLYGPASPLPTFYTEDLIRQEADEKSAVRDFLDIFNHRLFTLFFRCSMKYRLFFQVCEEKNPEILNKLYCLIGLGESRHRLDMSHAYSMIRYSGILSQHPRSAWGLETILGDTFSYAPVKVVQCACRRVKIPLSQRLLLGRTGGNLGIDSIIGGQIKDQTGKFRLRLGPLNYLLFQQLLPGSEENNRLSALTRFYLLEPLEYDMELILREGEASCVCLGAETANRLGMDTWIFSCEKIGEVRAVFPFG
ncbi:MAG: type VI secretion system baseplate subunit TssG [Smithellaceae bacterium]|nr:type VI secretion system baseplate subunit TssG [Smithellaceae bacterium]